MLAYAFQVLREDNYQEIEFETFEHVSDLLAAILAEGIANQIKRGIGREYLTKSIVSSTPAGKIDICTSINQRTMLKKQLVCEVDEYSKNSYVNMILKTTAMLLINCPEVSNKQKKSLKKVMLSFTNIDQLNPFGIKWSNIKYHRNNETYKMLINICYLVLNGLLLSEQSGSFKLRRYIDDQCMHNLFEKFVLGYYRKHYPEFNASVKYINWDVDDGVIDFLPSMKSDITLEYKGKSLIIDTKYYEKTMQTHGLYNSRTIHSHNLYQIFAYVKNKDISNSGNVSGVILYGKTDEDIVPDNEYMMSNSRICVKILDLNTDFSDIKDQLNKLVEWLLV